ncbi:MAG: tetratricopeptide repeat protein [Steroidobacteraceae bacterium]
MTSATLAPHALLQAAVKAFRQGKLSEADRSCRAVLAVNPDDIDAVNLLGIVHSKSGRMDAALATFDRAVATQPNHPVALFNRGLVLHQLQRFDEALASYDRALTVRPQHVETLAKRGNALYQLKRFAEALASYDRALALQPDHAEALANRGSIQHELKRFDQALVSYGRALALRPNDAQVLFNRGNTLHELKRFDEALASYDAALGLRPDYAEALTNRGNTLHRLERFDEALASYDSALALQPDHRVALINRGNTLQQLKRFDEALASYDRALTVRPDDAEAHWNRSLLLLLLGDFARGWTEYEWRWKRELLNPARRNFQRPLWLGAETIDGKTILLHAEQGLGDTIQFCRYAALVRARGARVVLEVQEPLRDLMASVAGVSLIVCRGETLPDFDLHCPLHSLPLALGTRLETIPSDIPYLRGEADKSQRWVARLGSKQRPAIGIAWAGGLKFDDDYNRSKSIAASALLPLLDVGATFVSLQKDVHPTDRATLNDHADIFNFGEEFADFSDTAALISHLDLVISVDTSVAHLAGALGKPVWVLLPFIPDWRWLLDRYDSPWYPTVRLFRQPATRRWDDVIEGVHDALRGFVETWRDRAAV